MSQQINLYNVQLLRQKKYFSANAMLQALLLILLGYAAFYGYAAYQMRQLLVQTDETANLYASEQSKLARMNIEFSPEQARKSQEEEIKKTDIRLVLQRELIATLKSGAIGNTSGYSEYMRAFARQASYGMWLTGFEISGDAVQMTIRGAALSPELVPVFIKRLSHESIMRGKEFAALGMQLHKPDTGKPEGRPYLDFTLHSSEAGGVNK